MSLLAPLLWSLVPSQLTHILLPHLSSSLPFIFPPSPRGSPIYTQNYNILFTFLVLAYLAYSFASDSGEVDNWYTLLGVGTSVDDDSLRKAFRTL